MLKRKGISYLLWFFIAFFTVAIIADNIFILDEWVRWLILIAGVLSGAFILISLWFLPSREYTSEKALSDIESEREDGFQLLRTAHQLEEKEQLSRNSLECKVLEEANELTSGKIWNTKYNNALDRSYWVLSRLFVIFLFVVLLSNGARVGLFRTLFPFAEIHYTRIKTGNPREFNQGEEVSVNVSVRGRRLNKVSIFISEDADWKELKFKTERNKKFQLDLKNRKKKFKYYVAMGDGKSPVKTINMISPPKIDSAWAEIEFPGYMQKDNEIQTGGHVKAYAGSWVFLHLKANQRMQEGRITLPGGTQTLMQVNNSELSFGFQMTDSLKGEYLVDGLDEHNEMLPMHRFKIESLVDQLPSVKLIDLTKDIEATSVTEIPISIHAYDEIGLSEVGLVVKVDNKEKEIARFAYNDSIVLERTELAQLLLEEFDLKQQSNVRIYAWAKDRNPNHEKRGVSVLRGIDIRPFRYTYLLPLPPGETPPPAMPQAEEALMQLEEMIQVQRDVLSKAFKAAEEGGGKEDGQKLAQTELTLSADAGKIYSKIKGKSGKADVLKQAGSKLDEASGMFDKADFNQGFNYGDQAMNLLTTLRDEVLKSLNKANASSSNCCKKKDVLSELAVDVDALIKQEQDVLERHQLFLQVPGNIDNFFQSTNLQRKTLVDTRELKSMLDIHPDGTKLSMERMDEVINEMTKSKDLLEGQKDAVGQINLTILRMQELAEHLRGMNVNPSGDMMRKALEKVEAVAQNLEKQAKDKKTIGKKDKNNSRQNEQQAENPGSNGEKSEKGSKGQAGDNPGQNE
ncbi:MAG: hypothetical protein PQJ28_03715, partial [Spirochaetales bacterium]|nr:hypothetical protein [Spirochaetales bacterium]